MIDKVKERIEKEIEEKTGKLNLIFCELNLIPKEVGRMIWLTELFLDGNQIIKLEGLDGLSSLTSLHLSNNQISKLEGLDGLSSLINLNLSNNQISKLEGLDGLSSLTNLYLSNNQIGKLEGLDGLSSLIELFLDGNQIIKLEEFGGLSNLTSLYLSNNQIIKLEEFGGLSSLTNLHISNNQISKLEGLDGLSRLTNLNLSSNQIIKLKGLARLSNLTNLHLSNNQIIKLEGLNGLPNLKGLFLDDNQIIKLEGLGGLSSLTTLWLHRNQIIKLEGLDRLSNLTELSFAVNQISKLEGLDGLSNLTSLYISKNQLKKLENLDGLSSLKELYLSKNQIVKLEGLNRLSSLTELFLDGNQISKLEGLDELSSLTNLNLSNNQIIKLEGLDVLSSLVKFSIRDNQISELEGLLRLLSLKILDFENNPISKFPPEYQAFLSSLPFLDLKGTKIENLSFFYQSIKQGKKILAEDIEATEGRAPNKEDYFQFISGKKTYHVKRGINVKDCKELELSLVAAIESGPEALLDYIKEPRERLFEARVLVLGEPRAGKTTLRRKLLDVDNPMPTPQESTKAFQIEIESYECFIEQGEQKEQLHYHLWDFGGQDYYRLLHQLFVAEQSVSIIVVGTDRNKTEEELEFWLETIERLGKDERQQYGPVILLQNPKNDRAGAIFTDLKSRYPFWQQTEDFVINLNFLSKQESSFDESQLIAFRNFEKYLSRSFCQLDHVGKEIPIKWIVVREALLKEKGNWISIERFNELCIENKIKDKLQRANLLDIFRQLGYLLHYKNTSLRGMVILNTEWVTDALYRVLDDPLVDKNKGWFNKGDVEEIWFEEKYENRTEELLALMQEFKLCYQNPTTKKYIVPSKLPSSTDNLPIWDATNNVRLHLQYDWMPKALIIQLLVSLHEYIVILPEGKQWIWRKGAVLDGMQLGLEGVQVQIKDEYDKERIAIEAKGTHSEDVIRVIMKKWREVNEPFKDKVDISLIILCPCATCSELKRPTQFDYWDVLRAREKGKPQYCNKSFESLSASDILKGIYDETTILVDSLGVKEKMHSSVLGFIRADELDKAIAAITSPDYNVLFARRLTELEWNSRLGTLTFEQKTQIRNSLAQDLVDYFTSERWQEQYKFEQLGEILPPDLDTFTSESNIKNRENNEAIPIKEKESPSVQVIVNNILPKDPTGSPERVNEKTTDKEEIQNALPRSIHKQWWFGRILGAILGGGIVGYFASKYANFHFGDTWLGITALVSTFLLMRNPKRAYLRWAGFCVMTVGGINILSQIDVAFKIIDTTEKTRPWDLLFKLGLGDEPIISVILGILAGALFWFDYKVRKENL